jgi:RNA polymerase sigma-70 factor (ECF subfamily)
MMTSGRPSDRSDRGCLRRLARGEIDALDELYRRHGRTAWRHALWVTGSRDDADDVVQAVFVKLAAGGADLLAIRRFRSYLGAMVHHEAIRLAREGSRQNEARAIDPDDLLAPSAVADQEGERALLARHLAELPAAQREVLLLRAYAGFSFREIGRALGVSTFTAASRWRLAIERLRKALGVEPNRKRVKTGRGADK